MSKYIIKNMKELNHEFVSQNVIFDTENNSIVEMNLDFLKKIIFLLNQYENLFLKNIEDINFEETKIVTNKTKKKITK